MTIQLLFIALMNKYIKQINKRIYFNRKYYEIIRIYTKVLSRSSKILRSFTNLNDTQR